MTPAPALQRTFNSKQVARIARCPMRQLQYWNDAGIVRPAIVLHSRAYTSEEVLMVLIIQELRAKHVALQYLHRLKLAGNFLLMNPGGRVRWADSPAAVIATMKAAPTSFVLVDVQELRAAIARWPL